VREAALSLHEVETEETLDNLVLSIIRRTFTKNKREILHTSVLLEALNADREYPWFNKEKGMTAEKLANLKTVSFC
jgi:hypothetical protein